MSKPVSLHPLAGVQPFLHELTTCVSAPTVALSDADGQIRQTGAQGLFSADVRVLGQAEVTVDGREPEAIASALHGADTAEFTGVVRWLDDPNPDPTTWLRRRRTVRADGMDETMTFVNVSARAVYAIVQLTLAADLVEVETVKTGHAGARTQPTAVAAGLQFAAGGVRVTIHNVGAQVEIAEDHARFTWVVNAAARSSVLLDWSVTVSDTGAVVVPSVGTGLSVPAVHADDRRLPVFIAQSVADLRGLRMTTPERPADDFLAAGSPWYLTLFGRDSIWAARMLLPLGTDLAAGTLRTLAFRQGAVQNTVTAEEPGKILHEIRRVRAADSDAFLPPVYYGTIDATPLWVCLLADAWRWGMPPVEVEELLPAAERALQWMVDDGDGDGDGFLEYADKSGRGLANQGWKDSADSIRFADGRIAVGPVALAEVQSYAYEAALAGAAMFDAFARPGAVRWREYAAEMKGRFADKFWTADDLGAYPVLALDGQKNAVDAPASNMGHLLASGILSREQAALVADRLVHPSMFSGFGLRTMSATAGGYSPLSYHCGSVWPHDTAIAIHGLARAGFSSQATTLADGLLRASAAFDGRLPELFGGFPSDEVPVPVPYPASCRPQAWSAAAAIVLLQSYLGLTVDVPGGTLTVSPGPTGGALSVAGLRVADAELAIALRSGGEIISVDTDAQVLVRSGSR